MEPLLVHVVDEVDQCDPVIAYGVIQYKKLYISVEKLCKG